MKTLNDILGYDLKIYQDQDWFCFSIDSIILANFPKIRLKVKKILDLGCGNGIVSLVLSLRTNAFIDGVEIQKDLADMAKESICYNSLSNQITIHNQDMKEFVQNKERYNSYDLIVCNPPYFRQDVNSTKNFDIHKIIARHEVCVTIEEIVLIVNKLLKEGGVFSTVNRVDRFIEIISLLREHQLEPKYVRFVYHDINSLPSLFYLEAIKSGGSGFIVDKPFIMYENGKETIEYSEMIREVKNGSK